MKKEIDVFDIFDFISDRSLVVSFRMKISDIKKLLSGEPMTVLIKGHAFIIKKAEQ
jgi:hypothetical protein